VVAGEGRLVPVHHKLEQFSTNISKQRGSAIRENSPLPLGRPQNWSFDGAAYASRRRLLVRRRTAETGLKRKLGWIVPLAEKSFRRSCSTPFALDMIV
jgi:hypothetical protein